MRVFSGKKCYIQIDDLIYALRNDYKGFPMDLYYYVISKYGYNLPSDTFIEITNSNHINYIKNSNFIFDFNFLNSKTVDELVELCDQIVRDSRLERSRIKGNNLKGYAIQSDPAFQLNVNLERDNRRYLLSQVKSVIEFKKKQPEIFLMTKRLK